ncbi:MAG: YncE family protein, partial [Phycisphaerae bacterium]
MPIGRLSLAAAMILSMGIDPQAATAAPAAVEKVYWAQTVGDRIRRADLDGLNVETLLTTPLLDDATALAIDPIARKVYWAQTQPLGGRILRADFDGRNDEIVVDWPLVDTPVALAVDPAGGKVYWAESFDPRIVRADLTGLNIQPLL